MGEVLLQRGHLDCGSLFNFFLKGSDFLLFGQDGVLVHLIVAVEGSGHDSGNGAFLLFAEVLCALDVVLGKAFLDFGNELGDAAGAFCALQCDSALNRENDNGEEESLKDRHDDTTLEHGTDKVDGVSLGEFVTGKPHGYTVETFSIEVRGVTEHEKEQ